MASSTQLPAATAEPVGRVAVALGLAALAVVWGTQYLVIREGQVSFPPLLAASLRFGLVAAVGASLALATGARAPAGLLPARLAFGLLQAASMGLLYWCQARIPSAVAALIFGTTPLFVGGLAHVFVPGERLRLPLVLAMLLGLLGVSAITLGGAHELGGALPLVGLVAALGGAAAGAGVKVVAKRITGRVPTSVMLRDLGLLVCGGNLAAFWVSGAPVPAFEARAVGAILYLGLVASAGATGLYLLLLRRFAVSRLAYLQFASTLVALLSGVWLGSERLGLPAIAGAAAILVGLLVAAGPAGLQSFSARRSARPPPIAPGR